MEPPLPPIPARRHSHCRTERSCVRGRSATCRPASLLLRLPDSGMHTLTEAHESLHFQRVLDGLLRRHRAAFVPGVLERDIVAKSFAGDWLGAVHAGISLDEKGLQVWIVQVHVRRTESLRKPFPSGMSVRKGEHRPTAMPLGCDSSSHFVHFIRWREWIYRREKPGMVDVIAKWIRRWIACRLAAPLRKDNRGCRLMDTGIREPPDKIAIHQIRNHLRSKRVIHLLTEGIKGGRIGRTGIHPLFGQILLRAASSTRIG